MLHHPKGPRRDEVLLTWEGRKSREILAAATNCIAMQLPTVIVGEVGVLADCWYPDDRVWSDRFGYTHDSPLAALVHSPSRSIPDLRGDPVSVFCGEAVRASLIVAHDTCLARYAAMLAAPGKRDVLEACREALRAYLSRRLLKTSAHWWIARTRFDYPRAVTMAAARAAAQCLGLRDEAFP